MEFDHASQQLKVIEELMARFQRSFQKHSIANACGLTGSQVFILRYLAHNPQAKASDIAKVSGLSPGAVTQVCDELVRLSLVERTRSSDDRRVVFITITPQGLARFEEVQKLRSQRMREIFTALGPEDASEFVRIIGRVVEIVEKDAQLKR